MFPGSTSAVIASKGPRITESCRFRFSQLSVPDAEIRKYVQEEADRHRQSLDELLDKHTHGTAITHMIKGQAGAVIPILQ